MTTKICTCNPLDTKESPTCPIHGDPDLFYKMLNFGTVKSRQDSGRQQEPQPETGKQESK